MNHLRLLPLVHDLHILADKRVGTGPEHKSHDETDADLSHNLVFTLQSFLVLAENLDVVVHETEESEPYGGDEHQDEVDVAHAAKQQGRNQDGNDDDDAAHGGNAFLGSSERVDGFVALRLGDVLALHELDEPFTEPGRNDQRQYQRQQRTE